MSNYSNTYQCHLSMSADIPCQANLEHIAVLVFTIPVSTNQRGMKLLKQGFGFFFGLIIYSPSMKEFSIYNDN